MPIGADQVAAFYAENRGTHGAAVAEDHHGRLAPRLWATFLAMYLY
jgi:hypothetical protein